MIDMQMSDKKIYFVSDFHLGIAAATSSIEREQKIIRWLDAYADDMAELYLVGDVFDYWYEYKTVVPKGYTRLFGKLGEIRDRGVPIYFFIGNHDMWMFKYFEEELDIPIYRAPIIRTFNGKRFFIGHGDGLGPGDYGYKIIKKVFANPISQWLFSLIHPSIALRVMKYFSAKSRSYTGEEEPFESPEKEWLVSFSEDYIQQDAVDYFVFGHRHLPIDFTLSNGKSTYFNLGEWMFACSYGVFDGERFELRFFESDYTHIYGNNPKNT